MTGSTGVVGMAPEVRGPGDGRPEMSVVCSVAGPGLVGGSMAPVQILFSLCVADRDVVPLGRPLRAGPATTIGRRCCGAGLCGTHRRGPLSDIRDRADNATYDRPTAASCIRCDYSLPHARPRLTSSA